MRNSSNTMNITCELSLFQYCIYNKQTVLVMNGSFSCLPGNLRIDIIADQKRYHANAWIFPMEQGKGPVSHQFELEYAGLPEEMSSLSLLLVTDTGEETVIHTCTKDEIAGHTVEQSIIYHVDSAAYNDSHVGTVIGWAYSTQKSSVSYEVYDENQQPVRTSLRRTLEQRLTDRNVISSDEVLCGFIVSFESAEGHSYTLKIDDQNTSCSIELNQYVQVSQPESGRIIHLLKKINKRNIKRGIRHLQKFGVASFFRRLSQGVTDEVDYDGWFKRNRITSEELLVQKEHHFEYNPKISIIVPTFNTPIDLLHEMIDSVTAQSYENWELCIADGSDADSKTRKDILACSQNDQRIKVTLLDENYGISGNTNKALELVTGEYTALFDHDDLLEPNALYEIVDSLQKVQHDIVYTDEDKLNDETQRFEEPNFKPDYDKDLFLSHNYITHFFVVKTEIIREVGGLDSRYDGSQDYDVMLKCIEKSASIHHVAKSLYHWRMHEGSTALDPESKMYCYVAGQNAIQAHLDRIGIKAEVQMQPKPLFGLYHVVYDVPDALVSIIIPNMDHVDVLKTCIDSLYKVSQFQNFEIIIVENNSHEEKTFDYYKQLQQEHGNLKVAVWDGKEFNFSAVNNFGASHAQGEYLLFLNNDTEMIRPDAISEMVGLCAREDVGVVGAKLLFADDTIQHAGVVIGFAGYAQHIFNDIPNGKDYGYMNRDVLNGDLSAVTAACMMTKKDVFTSVGGFDEQFKVACNDIDYCLKVREKGKLVAYNAFSLWHHYESKSRGYENGFDKTARFDDEVGRWQQKWMQLLVQGDQYYNRNFKVEDGPFILK